VFYSAKPLGDLGLRSIPGDLEKERQYSGVRLGTEPAEDSIPDYRDQVIEELGLSREERDRYDDVWEKWNSRRPETEPIPNRRPDLCHRMGGYPDRLQGDLRLEAQLVSHGLYCGNASGYAEGKQKGLWPGAKEWELLLQIDSEEAAGMMWGDVGRIYFLIHRDDLRERRFEKIWAGLECM
jgi:hypothetical protein